MVRIPAGMFLMGAFFAQGNPEERPAHEAIVAEYFLDEHEVTLGDYRKCVEAGKCPVPHVTDKMCNWKLPEDRERDPVNCIDLSMAAAYCSFAGKRLPSEREWEYAAGAGSERRRFSWGAEDPSATNSCYEHVGGTCKVGEYPAGAFGLRDMTGNVWEWTGTRFDPYPSRAGLDAIEPRKMYVYRGGSWSRRFPKWMRNQLRNRYQADQWSASIGVRCAQTVLPVSCPADSAPAGAGDAAQPGECRRTSGVPQCETGHHFDGRECKLGADSGSRSPVSSSAGTQPPGGAPSGDGDASPVKDPGDCRPETGDCPSTDAAPVISRSRTPQHDDDCKRHWPATPASYLFQGGPNYPSRKPAVRAAGCVPRDMSWNWTSACCPG
jgi:sulfatase-modifying factor enzyme 1